MSEKPPPERQQIDLKALAEAAQAAAEKEMAEEAAAKKAKDLAIDLARRLKNSNIKSTPHKK
jgi:hypothetical protein